MIEMVSLVTIGALRDRRSVGWCGSELIFYMLQRLEFMFYWVRGEIHGMARDVRARSGLEQRLRLPHDP